MAEAMTLFTLSAAAATLPPAILNVYMAWKPVGGRAGVGAPRRMHRAAGGVCADGRRPVAGGPGGARPGLRMDRHRCAGPFFLPLGSPDA